MESKQIIVDLKKYHKLNYQKIKHKLLEKVECEKCGRIVSRHQMRIHQNTGICNRNRIII